MTLSVTGAATGGGVRGVTTVGVRPGEPVERVALYVDGRLVSRDGSRPYELRFDTRGTDDGPHELLVYAHGNGGRRAALQLPVVVGNAPDVPVSLQLVWGGSLDDHVEPDALTTSG
jgi:hypothetical protein